MTRLTNKEKRMKDFRKIGGIAALYEAFAYVLGMVFYIFIVDYAGAVEPLQQVALLADNQGSMFLLTLIVFVIFALFLVVLSLALYERLKSGSPVMAQTAGAFGLIWACVVIASGMIFIIGMNNVVDIYGTDPVQASTAWLAIDSVFDGLGGGSEILGGIWILLVSWGALQAKVFPKALNYLGVVIGVVGILSIVPALEALTTIYGLGQIPWFIWLGIAMLKSGKRAA
jgi:hypothetical protein